MQPTRACCTRNTSLLAPVTPALSSALMDLAFPGMAAATVTISAQMVPMNSYATCPLDMLSWVQQSLANISAAMCISSVPTACALRRWACAMDMTIAVMVQMRHSAQVPFQCPWSLPVAAPSLSRLSTSTSAFHDREYAFGSLGYFTGKTFIKYSNDDTLTDDDSLAIDRAHCEVGKSWFVLVNWPRFHTVSSCRSVFPLPARHQQE